MLGRRWTWSLLAVLLLTTGTFLVQASEDAADGQVQDDVEGDETPVQPTGKEGEAAEETTGLVGPSPDAQVSFIFTSPPNARELVAGKVVKFLIGLANKGEKDFTVKQSETSFRYPLDFSYHIQNFTAARYERLVQPKQEATFDYAFIPSDQFIGRPLGLVVNLHYVDQDGAYYVNTVFNETVTIVEDESTFNTETGFLYVVFAGIVVLLLLVAQHYLSKFTRKAPPAYNPVNETGTNKNEVDFEWIPRSTLEKKSPKPGSPRNRRPQKAQ
ncbi:translocon-associated protein alpha [Aphelenchoides avenae]|nr:translocon-associated protein alpha [Aphelenchus avenae]